MNSSINPIRLLVATSVCLLLASCGGDNDDNQGPPPLPIPQSPAAGTVGDNRLPEILEWARASQGLPAMTALVISNGRVAERAAVGQRSVSADIKVTTEDKWHVGSITKSMTSTLAALMVEDGSISWDTRPVDVWPELANTIHPDFRNTTLRQLLTHTSGMKRDDDYSGAEDNASGTLMQKRRAWAARVLERAADVPS